MMRIAGVFIALALAILFTSNPARAQAPELVKSNPAASAVVPSRDEGVFVYFNRPIDHLHSTLSIEQNGATVLTLRPLADSAADVLYSRRPTLKPGQYTLHWVVQSLDGLHRLSGDIPFTVD